MDPTLRWWQKLLLGLLVALLVLAGAEGLLRLGHGQAPQRKPIYEAPDLSEPFVEEGEEVVAAYQAPPSRFSAWPTGPRVAFLGGSTVHQGSAGLDGEEEFPLQVGQRLEVQAVNLGCPALDSGHLVRLLPELLRWRFDAVVVYTGHNDFGNAWWRQGQGQRSRHLSVRLTSVLEHTWLFHHLRTVLRRSVQGSADASLASGLPPRMESAQRQQVLDQLELNLRALVREGHAHGVTVALATPVSDVTDLQGLGGCAPQEPCAVDLWRQAEALRDSDPPQATALYWQALAEARPADRAPQEVAELVRAVAHQEGAVLVDLAADLPREEGLDLPDSRLFVDHLHLSRWGHQAVARRVSAALSEAPPG